MDTKSKNFRYSSVFKLLAALVCVAGALAAGWGLKQVDKFYLAFTPADYARSDEVTQKLDYVSYSLSVYPLAYATEMDVEAGEWITESQLRDRTQSAEYTYSDRMNEAESRYGEMIDRAQQDDNDEEVTNLLAGKQAYQDELKSQLEQAKAAARQQLIDDELRVFRNAQRTLNNTQGVYYYARSAGGKIVENTGGEEPEGFFRKLSAYRTSDPAGLTMSFGYYGYAEMSEGAAIWVGLLPEAFNAGQQVYLDRRSQGEQGLLWFVFGMAAFFIGLGWLAYAAGRRPGVEGVQLIEIDRVWLDVGLGLLALVLFFCGMGFAYILNNLVNVQQTGMLSLHVLGGLLAAAAACAVMLYVTSAAKRIKRREFFRHTLVYTVASWVIHTARSALGGGPLALKAAALFIGYAIVSSILIIGVTQLAHGYSTEGTVVLFLLFLTFNTVALVWVLKKATALSAITNGARRIRAGELDLRLKESGGTLGQLAASINNIAQGLEASLNDRVKAERMKTELVTNVSHDLKTPLTSIITYIDLMKAEGPGSERALEYIRVLDQKAQRLKALTDDLFEAAKAASGSIQPSLTRLDVCALISQGMGELADRIADSGLEFRTNLPADGLTVLADGRLLWRVIENLFSNTFKYAIPKSRVYVSAVKSGGNIRVEVKNVSAFELNMPAEELMERFTRGDRSRHSEGSGLGLAIAKSLTELMGGSFRVEIDGDLFKAILEFSEA